MKIMVINGPNLNMLGKRDAEHYGSDTLPVIERKLSQKAKALGCELIFFQSNHEGAIVDYLQQEAAGADGIIINPGALTHYSYAIRDAIKAVGIPTVEVHLSDIEKREEFRKTTVIREVCLGQVKGMGSRGYVEALEMLLSRRENG